MENILVISSQVVTNNSKINWPDLNYPGSGQTVLRTLHKVNYEDKWIQLDHATGPVIQNKDLPIGTGFYTKV